MAPAHPVRLRCTGTPEVEDMLPESGGGSAPGSSVALPANTGLADVPGAAHRGEQEVHARLQREGLRHPSCAKKFFGELVPRGASWPREKHAHLDPRQESPGRKDKEAARGSSGGSSRSSRKASGLPLDPIRTLDESKRRALPKVPGVADGPKGRGAAAEEKGEAS